MSNLKIAENRYYIDGMDMFVTWGVGVESGSDNFLKFPKRKEGTVYNWKDQNGEDADLTRVFFEARDIELNCFILADSESEFWSQYQSFLGTWQKPGTRRFTVVDFSKDYEVYYLDCNIYTKVTSIKVQQGSFVGCKFNLKLREPDPTLGQPEYITDQEDKFLIS